MIFNITEIVHILILLLCSTINGIKAPNMQFVF